MTLAVVPSFVLALATLVAATGIDGNEFMDRLQAIQRSRGDMSAHVHAQGRVEEVDPSVPSVTLTHSEIGSPDGRIWMPAMRMTFHVSSDVPLAGLKRGDIVRYVAQRLKGAVTITEIRPQP